MSEQLGCLILIVGNLHVPEKAAAIPSDFQNLLNTDKINYVLCAGNIGNEESYNTLSKISENFYAVHGEFDLINNCNALSSLPEYKTASICNKRFGLVHGHQNFDENFDAWQRKLNCEILITGNSNRLLINKCKNYTHLNPGSLTGASPEEPPSFMLMNIVDDQLELYAYQFFKQQSIELSRIFVHGARCFFWDFRKFGSYDLQPAVPTAPNIINELYPKSLQINAHYIDAIIYAVDASSPGRLQLARSDFEKLMKIYHNVNTVLILATKSDLNNTVSDSFIRNQVIESAFDRELHICFVSAVTGEGIMPALDWLNDRMGRERGCLSKQCKPFFVKFFSCC